MKTERVLAEVYVTLRYDSQKSRKAAIQDLQRHLGLYSSSTGEDGDYMVKTGRVIAPKEPNRALATPVGWTLEQIEAAALAEVKKEPKS